MFASAASSAYISDILVQPDCLRRLQMGHVESEVGAAIGAISRYRRIILTGMGSSYAALRPLWTSLVESGHQAWRVDAAECLGHFAPLIDRSTLVVAASQSGRSAELVALAELVTAQGATLLAITNDLESPLARGADAVVHIGVGVEHAVSTKTYLNTLGAGLALERLFLDRPFDDILEHTADAMDLYLRDWRGRTEQLKVALGLPDRLYFLARGASLAAAEYGALIAKEAARWPVEAQSAAQFRHGPMELADGRLSVIVVAGREPTAWKHNRALFDDLKRYGARPFWLDADGKDGPFSIPGVPADASWIVEALPLQLLSVALAEQSGIPPGEFRHLQKVTTVL
jgi:glucosamine--fructose-6-phosphate aminotransferase (isomerizing)